MKLWTFLLLGTLALVGCQEQKPGSSPSSKLVTAKLDTLPILQSDPEYQILAKDYAKENLELSKRIKGEIDSGKLAERDAPQKYMVAQEKLNKKWMAATNDFIQTRHGTMRDIVKQMCEEKGIDIVLIDSKAYPTVEYGALDITQDVLMKIHGGMGSPPMTGGTPNATP